MATTTAADLLDQAAGGGAPTAETDGDAFASKLTREADIIIGVYLILIGTGSTLGNGRVLWLSYRNWKKLRPVELLVASLAVTDVGISLFGYPFAATSSLLGRWSFGTAGCTWYGFTGFFFGITSIATMALMSLLRFMIVYKGYPGSYPSRRKTGIIVAAGWLYGLFWACLPLAGWSQYHVEPFGLSCTVDWGSFSRDANGMSFILCMIIFCTAVPVAAMVASYAAIFYIYRRAKKGVDRHLKNNAVMSQKRREVERSITLMALAVCGGFLFAWMPYAVVGMWSAVAGADAVPIALASAAPLFAKSSSLWNPIIYLGMSDRFRLNMCGCFATPTQSQTAVHAHPQQPGAPLPLSPRGPLVSNLPTAVGPLPGALQATNIQ
uniref:Neuropsin n=1 Tax=Branchiostoma belcheri TaxID=7741 RepID=A0A455ZBU5_BRABE|nr:TPA_exp: neuropsin [Branchiostoma belcheri]